jgi:ABC-type protease/lipase transport system fused ATPase/permease subunit
MSCRSFLLIAVLGSAVFASENLFAQTTSFPSSSDSAAARQKHKEEIAREKREAVEQWSTNSQKALETWAATRQKRQDCQRLASEKKLYFTKRSRFLRECMSGKAP